LRHSGICHLAWQSVSASCLFVPTRVAKEEGGYRTRQPTVTTPPEALRPRGMSVFKGYASPERPPHFGWAQRSNDNGHCPRPAARLVPLVKPPAPQDGIASCQSTGPTYISRVRVAVTPLPRPFSNQQRSAVSRCVLQARCRPCCSVKGYVVAASRFRGGPDRQHHHLLDSIPTSRLGEARARRRGRGRQSGVVRASTGRTGRPGVQRRTLTWR